MGGVARSTTAATVKGNAVAVLTAACAAEFTTAPAPQVSYGFPGEADLSSEMVFIGGAELDDDWAQIGRGSRDENYTLDLIINVERAGATQQEVTERAFTILTVCDKALTNADDLFPENTAGWAIVVFRRLVERPGDASREAEITAGIRVFARI